MKVTTMQKNITTLFTGFLLLINSFSNAQEVNKALELFLNNKMHEAEVALVKLSNDASCKERGKAGVALALIHKLNDNTDEKVKCYVDGIKYLSEPDAYAYTLWGNCYFYNYPAYSSQLKKVFAARSNVHPDINYCLDGMNRRIYVLNNQLDSVFYLNKSRGYIDQWEFLGAFDYNDGYGFYNDEKTLSHPENTFQFNGKFGAGIKWFPLIEKVDVSAIDMNDYIDLGYSSSSKMYAQTFLQSDIDQEVILTIVCGMDVKCWLNDALIYENRKNIENINALPFHLPLKLKKGSNRILFQLGKKSEYETNFETYIRDKNDQPLSSVYSQLKNRAYAKETQTVIPIKDPNIESFNVQVFTDYLKSHPNDLLEQILRVEELNSNNDKEKTLNAVLPLFTKYPNSYYISNLYYNNKPNVSYSAKDEYLNQKCENCFSTLESKFRDAKEEKNKTKINEALDKLEKNFPGNISVLMLRIDYLMEENEYSEADKLIEQGLKKYENHLLFYSYKADLLKAQSKKKEQLAYLNSILPTRNNTFVEDRLRTYYMDENDTLNWMKLTKNMRLYSSSDDLYDDQIRIYNESKKYDSSEAVIKELIAKKPYSASNWEQYGDLMLEKSDKGKAIEYFKKSLELDPLNYDLIKKLNSNEGRKSELDSLLSQTIKELFQDRKVDKIEIPLNLQKKNWVILLKKSASVMYSAGLNCSKNFIFYKIMNEAGINEFKEFSGSGLGSDVLIFKQDGQVVLPESGYSSMVLTDLKVGDIIGMKYENQSSSASEYISSKYQNIISNLENEPLVLLEEHNLISKQIAAQPIVFDKNKAFQMTKSEWNKSFDLYQVTSKNPLYIEPELYPSDLLFNHSFIVTHNYQSWDEVAKWYWEIASPKLIANDTLKNTVQSILKNARGKKQYDQAKLMYQWIEKNINYSSQSFRQDNYVPQLPSKVIEDKLGDCKDLAALFITMCREAGIPGHFCLVNMDQRASMYRQYPNINFNHCIARIYADGQPYYVELTSKSLPFAQNVNYATYGYGLEIDPERICNVSDLYNPGNGDIIYINSNVKNSGANVAIDGQIQIIGMTSAVIKDAFEKIDSSQINTAVQKMINDLVPNMNVQSNTYNSNDKLNDTVHITFRGSSHDMFTDVADLYVYKLPSFLNKIVEESPFANPDRLTDFSFLQSTGMMLEAVSTINITIPANRKVFKKPENVKISNQFFEYDVSLIELNNTIKIVRSLKGKTKVVKAADFKLYKEEMEKAYKNDLITLVMQ